MLINAGCRDGLPILEDGVEGGSVYCALMIPAQYNIAEARSPVLTLRSEITAVHTRTGQLYTVPRSLDHPTNNIN